MDAAPAANGGKFSRRPDIERAREFQKTSSICIDVISRILVKFYQHDAVGRLAVAGVFEVRTSGIRVILGADEHGNFIRTASGVLVSRG